VTLERESAAVLPSRDDLDALDGVLASVPEFAGGQPPSSRSREG